MVCVASVSDALARIRRSIHTSSPVRNVVSFMPDDNSSVCIVAGQGLCIRQFLPAACEYVHLVLISILTVIFWHGYRSEERCQLLLSSSHCMTTTGEAERCVHCRAVGLCIVCVL